MANKAPLGKDSEIIAQEQAAKLYGTLVRIRDIEDRMELRRAEARADYTDESVRKEVDEHHRLVRSIPVTGYQDLRALFDYVDDQYQEAMSKKEEAYRAEIRDREEKLSVQESEIRHKEFELRKKETEVVTTSRQYTEKCRTMFLEAVRGVCTHEAYKDIESAVDEAYARIGREGPSKQ